VVNCIILGRAESYASKNPVLPSIFDGIGMGLGFTLSLTILGALRELLGAGTCFGITIYTEELMPPISIFVLAPGAFFVLAMVIAVRNRIIRGNRTAAEAGCDKIDCGHCGNTACAGHSKAEA
jgi:electron transport complex protein RnfE